MHNAARRGGRGRVRSDTPEGRTCRGKPPGEGVEEGGDAEERGIAGDQREVFEGAAGHRAEQVGAELRGRIGRLAETLGEGEIGDEDREEGERGRGEEARPGRQAQESAGRYESGEREPREEEREKERRPVDLEAALDLDREEDREQDAAEDERVDEPGRAEEESELDDALGLEQHERRAHPEEVESAAHLAE